MSEHLQRQLEVSRLFAARPAELAALLVDELHQELQLRVLCECDPAQLLDVLLALEVTALHFFF